jgi:hypothetical protein
MTVPRLVHDKLPGLYEQLASTRIYFRVPDRATRSPTINAIKNLGIDRDRVICALLSKAANTTKAITVLCDSRLADDAYALFRVLLENYICLAWMLNIDWTTRVDTYWLSAAPVVTRWAKVLEEHYPDQHQRMTSQSDRVSQATAVSREVFEDKWIGWARFAGSKEPVQLRAMFEELYPDDSHSSTGPVLYARGYFESSLYVHSLPRSLQEMFTALRNEACYKIIESPSASSSVEYVLRVSAVIMLATLSTLDTFLNAGLASDISELTGELERSSEGLADG